MTPSVVGVDLGGTKLAVASLSGGELSESVTRPTELSDTAALIDQVVEAVGEARGEHLDGVGVGVPSVVEFETGRVVSSVNVPLADVPLRQVLGERLGVPVFVDNDATVAALAEAHDEELRLVARNLVMLTVGTGVGGGLVLGGRIYRGSTGGAAEIGHTIVGLALSGEDPVPTPEGFPLEGSLEAVAAGHALDRLAAETAKLYPDSALGRLEASGETPSGGEAVHAAYRGDEVAARIIEVWAERVGIGVSNAINTFDPDEVVIGGGAALAGDRLLGPATRVAREYAHPGLADHVTIRLARHGVRAGVLGAALLAVHELEPRVEPSTTEVSR
ncbi:MAG TPA: ROK family protein [Solirubrobacteraceae bacterium]|nr:ROK family protein [Solirubrobacteraceae bacterium]